MEGVDISKESIKLLRSKAKKEHLQNVHAQVLDFHQLSTRRKFDYVLLVNVIHHVSEVEDLLDKIKSVLNTNGKVIIFEGNCITNLYRFCLIILWLRFCHPELGLSYYNLLFSPGLQAMVSSFCLNQLSPPVCLMLSLVVYNTIQSSYCTALASKKRGSAI